MRLQKLPYKKIASHLEKTELACRLHYHQLSHGGNRRKRNNSVSSNSSDKSASGAIEALNVPPTGKNRVKSPPNASPVSSTGAIQKASAASPSKPRGKPLLPKTPKSTGQSGNGSGAASARKVDIAKGRSLKLNCNTDAIDKLKLEEVVREQERRKWNAVAEAFGNVYTPEYLQKLYNEGTASAPPTPAVSPSSRHSSPAEPQPPIENHSRKSSLCEGRPSEICGIPEEPEGMNVIPEEQAVIEQLQVKEEANTTGDFQPEYVNEVLQ